MARFVFAAFACSLCFNAAAAEIDLRNAGALENLQRTNPAHRAKIERIQERAWQFPQEGPARWLPAALNASDVRYTRGLMKTSYPPKETLRFTLDDVRYVMDVTRHDVAARLTPAPRPDLQVRSLFSGLFDVLGRGSRRGLASMPAPAQAAVLHAALRPPRRTSFPD
jgi:hypothetical protein